MIRKSVLTLKFILTMRGRMKILCKILGVIGGTGIVFLTLLTYWQMQPVPADLTGLMAAQPVVTYVDRQNIPLTYRYRGRWNQHFQLDRDQIPLQFEQLLLLSEDQRFYDHHGVDWIARLQALWLNLRFGSIRRGASTITEQVVRMIHPRPRHFWSRWIEGWEAIWLEQHVSKAEILNFYINQVPFSRQRRGLWQAAHLYFKQHPQNLTLSEMLALIVMIRAPSAYDPLKKNPKYQQKFHWAIRQLADRAVAQKLIDHGQHKKIDQIGLNYSGDSDLYLAAPHFIDFLEQEKSISQTEDMPAIRQTSLDASLQRHLGSLMDQYLRRLRPYQVQQGAVIIADHVQRQILAWHSTDLSSMAADRHSVGYDIARLPRQPGSTLKPFIYAMALEKGWHLYQLIDDSPLIEAVGGGLHAYQNYSNHFYGRVSLKDALGNSLNIPALRALQYVGQVPFLRKLRALGFTGLTETAQFYGDGLVIGNGAVSLWQMVQAYSVLAQRGMKQDYAFYLDHGQHRPKAGTRLFSEATADLLSYILSDPQARKLEFGQDSILSFPMQTAVKTGTSNDHRDAWLMAYNDRYVVGIWMGNLDQTPMLGVTGSTGPAPLARQIFQYLNKGRVSKSLPVSPDLWSGQYCFKTDWQQECQMRYGLFHHSAMSLGEDPLLRRDRLQQGLIPLLERPTHNLRLAVNPRVPLADQAFQFHISNIDRQEQVHWHIQNSQTGQQQTYQQSGGGLTWALQKGQFWVKADLVRQRQKITFGPVRIFVR